MCMRDQIQKKSDDRPSGSVDLGHSCVPISTHTRIHLSDSTTPFKCYGPRFYKGNAPSLVRVRGGILMRACAHSRQTSATTTKPNASVVVVSTIVNTCTHVSTSERVLSRFGGSLVQFNLISCIGECFLVRNQIISQIELSCIRSPTLLPICTRPQFHTICCLLRVQA